MCCGIDEHSVATKHCCCRCKKEEDFPYCESTGGKEGTICGADGDYFEFDVCNKGPGICKNIESDYGDFGLCLGIPKLGAACNDYDDCTKDDKCKVVITNDGQAFRGQCMGKFAGEIPCNDYNDECTSNDRCFLFDSCSFMRLHWESQRMYRCGVTCPGLVLVFAGYYLCSHRNGR